MDNSNRTDNFARLRNAPEIVEEFDPDAPVVTPQLIEWLEARFPGPRPARAESQDDLVFMATGMALCLGQRNVIDHLKTLVKGS